MASVGIRTSGSTHREDRRRRVPRKLLRDAKRRWALAEHVGETYASFTVVRPLWRRRVPTFWCRCECGCEVIVLLSELEREFYKTCGWCRRKNRRTPSALFIRTAKITGKKLRFWFGPPVLVPNDGRKKNARRLPFIRLDERRGPRASRPCPPG